MQKNPTAQIFHLLLTVVLSAGLLATRSVSAQDLEIQVEDIARMPVPTHLTYPADVLVDGKAFYFGGILPPFNPVVGVDEMWELDIATGIMTCQRDSPASPLRIMDGMSQVAGPIRRIVLEKEGVGQPIIHKLQVSVQRIVDLTMVLHSDLDPQEIVVGDDLFGDQHEILLLQKVHLREEQVGMLPRVPPTEKVAQVGIRSSKRHVEHSQGSMSDAVTGVVHTGRQNLVDAVFIEVEERQGFDVAGMPVLGPEPRIQSSSSAFEAR